MTTSPGRATQPEPSTASPQALPITRTMLRCARFTPGRASTRGLGGAIGATGAAIAGKGSTRESALRTLDGGTIVFSSRSTYDRWAPRRSFVCPGSWSATAPTTQTIASAASPPTSSPPAVSTALSGRMRRLERRTEPASVPSVSNNTASSAAPARAASGV